MKKQKDHGSQMLGVGDSLTLRMQDELGMS